MMTWLAIMPTTELETPEAMNETMKTAAAPPPNKGIKVR
jgi:hypothetical protein